MHQAALKILQVGKTTATKTNNEQKQVRCFLPPVSHERAGILNWT